MRLRLLALCLAAVTLRAQVPIHDARIAAAVHRQMSPSIASDGDAYYVVWADHRSGVVDRPFGSVVDPDGHLVNPLGTLLARGPTDPRWPGVPVVVWDGRFYVVVAAKGAAGYEAVRLEPDGTLIDAIPLALSTSSDLATPPLVTTNGRTILFSSRQAPWTISIFTDGLAPAATFTYETLAVGPYSSVAASDGENYIVIGGRTGAVISTSGVVARFTVPDFAFQSDVTWIGDSYLYVGTDFDVRNPHEAMTYRMFAMRFDRSGNAIGTPATLVNDVRASFVRVVAAGDHRAVVAYEQSGTVFTIETDGSTASAPRRVADVVRGVDVPTYSLAASRDGIVAALTTKSGIELARLDRNGAPLDPNTSLDREDTQSFVEQRGLALDRRATPTLAIWNEEDGSGVAQLFVRRLGRDGKPFGNARVPYVSPGSQESGAIARGASNHLVVWIEDRMLLAGRLSNDGAALDAAPLQLGSTSGHAAVAWNGTVYLIAFATYDGRARISRITSDGVLLDPAPRLVAEPQRAQAAQSQPTFAHMADEMFLFWQEGSARVDCRFLCLQPPPAVIIGIRLGANATPIESSSFLVSGDETYALNPDAASIGGHVAVTWVHYPYASSADVHARRFARDGTSPDATPIDLGISSAYTRPSITGVNGAFVIAWEMARWPASWLFDVAIARLNATTGDHVSTSFQTSVDRRAPIVFPTDAGPALAFEDFPIETGGVSRIELTTAMEPTSRGRAARP